MTRAHRWSWSSVIVVAGLGIVADAAGRADADDPRGCAEELARQRAENARLAARVAALEARIGDLDVEKRDLEIVAGVRSEAAERDAETAVRGALATTVAGGGATVTTPLRRVTVTHGSRAPHWVRFRLTRPAASNDPPPRIFVDVTTRGSDGFYRGLESMTLTADDGDAIPGAVIAYDANRATAGGGRKTIRRDNESLTIEFPAASLARLAAAERIAGRLGPIRFTFGDDQRAALRVLQAMLAPPPDTPHDP
jgi:hypothetical protein